MHAAYIIIGVAVVILGVLIRVVYVLAVESGELRSELNAGTRELSRQNQELRALTEREVQLDIRIEGPAGIPPPQVRVHRVDAGIRHPVTTWTQTETTTPSQSPTSFERILKDDDPV